MSSSPKLEKTIGLWSSITIVVGTIIGSSIFMKPATMAAQLPSPYFILLVWVVAGIVSLFGAMAYAELGSMFPESGGQYVFLRYSYNDFVAYLYGWGGTVVNAAAIAAISFVFASYGSYFIKLPDFNSTIENSAVLHLPMIGDIFLLKNFGVKSLAIITILFLTIVNYLSVRSSNLIQVLATVLKVAAIVLLIGGIFFFGHGNTSNFFTNAPGFNLNGKGLFVAFMAATTGAFASYDGWNLLTMLSGEIKNPQKNITRSLVIGLWICIAVYVMITLAFMYVLPIEKMGESQLVASDAISVVFGNVGGGVIAALIVVSTFGSINVNLLGCARVVLAMGETRTFFPQVARIHPKFKTPYNAVLVMGFGSCLLVLSGSFDLLADMFIFISWIFYGLVILGLFILRRKMPEKERPYKAWGYPLVPAIFFLFTVVYVVTTLYYDINNYINGKSAFINSVFGILLSVIGIPFYFYFKKKNNTG